MKWRKPSFGEDADWRDTIAVVPNQYQEASWSELCLGSSEETLKTFVLGRLLRELVRGAGRFCSVYWSRFGGGRRGKGRAHRRSPARGCRTCPSTQMLLLSLSIPQRQTLCRHLAPVSIIS